MNTPNRKQILHDVKSSVASSDVAARVVAERVEAEVNRRAQTISSGLVKYEDMERQLSKLKPDVDPTFDGQGNQVTAPAFSKNVLKQRDDLTKKMAKLEAAIDKALAGDYGDLNNLVQAVVSKAYVGVSK